MKLKVQPRPSRRPQPSGRSKPRRFRGVGQRSRGAQRPGVPIGRRVGARLPSLARAAAAIGAIAATAALAAALNGPWLRITEVAVAGEHYTPAADVEAVLAEATGMSALVVDTGSVRTRLEALPAVDVATVDTSVFGRIEATVDEHDAAFVWLTPGHRYLGARDGTLFADLGADDPLAADLAALPQISDQRFLARLMGVGDVIPDGLLTPALQLVATDPAAFGSSATTLRLRVDDDYGFRLVSESPKWEVALGVYGMDPSETAAEAAAWMERQVAAVRTLFAERSESEISWVDVRNPGKVYFRAKG